MNKAGGNDSDFKFELTTELIDQIIFCMENQHEIFSIDCVSGECIPSESIASDNSGANSVPLPEWKPADGFMIMEKFIFQLHNPLYKEELRSVMNLGRGVFKNFKSIVKKYEPLKKRWYNFKDRYMKKLVIEWYKTHNETWYLNKIGTETLETEDLILSDFTFSSSYAGKDSLLVQVERAFTQEIFADDPLLGRYILKTLETSENDPSTELLTVCANALDGSFSGIIRGIVWNSSLDNNVTGGILLVVDILYVEPGYRGFGLSKMLLEKIIQKAGQLEVSEIYLDVPAGLTFFERMLEKEEFQSTFHRFRKKLLLPY